MVVLAGGTMEPIAALTSIFSSGGHPYTFIKGQHVIKQDQCHVYCIGGVIEKSGNDKKKTENSKYRLTFTYNTMKQDCNNIMGGACAIIKSIVDKTAPKSGIVIFIQNYNLLETIAHHLGHTYGGTSVYYDTPISHADTHTQVNKNSK